MHGLGMPGAYKVQTWKGRQRIVYPVAEFSRNASAAWWLLPLALIAAGLIAALTIALN